jgi:hypothetical protein
MGDLRIKDWMVVLSDSGGQVDSGLLGLGGVMYFDKGSFLLIG